MKGRDEGLCFLKTSLGARMHKVLIFRCPVDAKLPNPPVYSNSKGGREDIFQPKFLHFYFDFKFLKDLQHQIPILKPGRVYFLQVSSGWSDSGSNGISALKVHLPRFPLTGCLHGSFHRHQSIQKPNCIKGVHFKTYPASTSEGIKPVLTPPGASQGAGLSHTQVCTGTTQGQIWGRSQFVPWNVNAHVVLAWQNASGSDLRALCEGQMEELGFLLTLQSWCCILAVLSCWLKRSPAQSQTETKFLQATRWLPESCWKHHKCRRNCSVCIYWLSVCLHIFFSNRDANKPWEGQTRFTQEAIGALEPRCQ